MESFRLLELLWNYLEQLPSLLALAGGIIFAIIRWKAHPKVSLVVMIALGFLLIHALVFTIVYYVVPPWFIRSYIGSENLRSVIQNVYLVLALISNSIATVGFGVLLAGIFMKRKPEALNESQTA